MAELQGKQQGSSYKVERKKEKPKKAKKQQIQVKLPNARKCEICDKEYKNFGVHLIKSHNISPKEYYDKYLKKDDEGVCPVCGSFTRFRNVKFGYRKHCSVRCGSMDPIVQAKNQNTCMKRYNTPYISQVDEFKDKARETKLQKYGDENYNNLEKMRFTNTQKYGNPYPLQNEGCLSNLRNPNLGKYGFEYVGQVQKFKEKSKQTCIEKYGVPYSLQDENTKAKSRETCLKKYGFQYANQSDFVKDKIMNTMINNYGCHYFQTEECRTLNQNHESWVKASNTRRLNGNLSRLEDKFELWLKQNNIEYKKDYNEDLRYPYHCDFYLPEYDIFIEINGYWTHGGHWFDESDINDLKLLSNWQEKVSSNHPQYEVAINTWTISDIEKRNYAIINNLNYIVLWNNNDIDDFCRIWEEGEVYG